jgi:hypothetical protein
MTQPNNQKLREALERILQDAGLEDDYDKRDSDGRFISKNALVNARKVLIDTEIKHEWEFYMNGSFCKRCGVQLGSNQPCR